MNQQEEQYSIRVGGRDLASQRLRLAGAYSTESDDIHHVQRIANDELRPHGLQWNAETAMLSGELTELDQEKAEKLLDVTLQNAAARVAKWHKKKDWARVIFLGGGYLFLVIFAANVIEQTHGWVSFVATVAAFGFLYIPWWLFKYVGVVDNLVGEP